MTHQASEDLLSLHVLMIRSKYVAYSYFDSPYDYPFQDYYNILEHDEHELMKEIKY